MSTLERKEYQETKIMRTVSPVRNYSSNQNLSQFDSNLDYLLEDLQNSVSRPGSSLGQHSSNTYRESSRSGNALESNRSNSLSRMVNTKSSNPVTEYSSDDAYNYKSPDGRQQISGYKKEKYMYSTTTNGDILPEKTRMQNSINQLDTLLDDLQQVKKSSFSEKESYNSPGADPAFHTTSSKNVNRELHYGDTPRPSSRSHTFERSEREASLKRELQYNSEGTAYPDTRPLRTLSPSPTSKTSTLTKQTKVKNVHEYPIEVSETVVPDIDPEVLAHLDPNLRPPGNTKVTTTIKTYTYEIPGSGDFPAASDEKYVYSPNQSISTPSKSFVYNKMENKENVVYQQDPYNYPPYQKPSPPGGVVVKETVTTRNYQPGYRPELNPPTNQTYVYNETNTTKNITHNGHPQPPPMPRKDTYIVKEHTTTNINKTDHPRGHSQPHDGYPPKNDGYPSPDENNPPGRKTYIYKETHNTVNRTEPPFSERGYPVYNPPDNSRGNPPSTTYIIKETHNTTTNRTGSPYQNGYPPNEPPKTIIYQHETHTTNNSYGPGGPNRPKTPNEVETFDPNNPPSGYGFKPKPKEPINIHYSYKSTNTTQNSYKGGYPPNEESQHLLPQKFPTDDGPDGPPKRLDELMATIGNEPPNSPLNAGFTAHEQEKAQQKKIDTLKRQAAEVDDTQKKEPAVKTKNVSGPPVYYPPGHEMFAKKEESEAAWRAQGGYARASGKYQYEAESRSKSKSSSGATVVPVCLPLCCGLPCVLL
nr:proteoglycan 4 [Leptinotarsa decemlineata]XP_023015075.1 proteoglycan 4 [Leptinotarsa decemlineata]XP_023015076.1 proteoglycan 4 [Leptinotarsa decemlineata]